MNRDQLLDIVREATVTILGADPATITTDTHFANDLDADSLALVEIITEIEDRLDIQVPTDELKDIHTVGAAVELLETKVGAAA